MTWETVIGLEIHVQLATASKIFSSASTAYGAPPNTQACGVDLGLPGVLPVINQTAVEMAIKLGLAIEAEIAVRSIFARKNYFYPDLPKGYQISQFEDPIVSNGKLSINVGDHAKQIRILRAHLEEDAGKSVHEVNHTGVDLNRAGTPLIEVVSEPDMTSAAEAVAYMRTLHLLVRTLEICDGNMQEGSFRCDANVSVRKPGEPLGTRTETKNLNSFRFVERAIDFEVERQIDILEAGGAIEQETRLYDPDNDETRTMRSKEDAHDYRYFPDPDLLPVVVSAEQIEKIREQLPELPPLRRQRYIDVLGLKTEDADTLVSDPLVAAYFDTAVDASNSEPAKVANWVVGDLFGALKKYDIEIDESPISAVYLAQLVDRISDGTISGKIAKTVFEAVWEREGSPDEVIKNRGLTQVTDDSLIASVVAEVISENPDQVEQFKAGKTKVMGFLVGQAMKKTKGQANPKQINEALQKALV
ncbi:MAG: Asp-tRNA(Asn)/Glu-tRNA(Gln) amidotransferase subunit GatB [Pseudomonadota bacterium]